MADWKVFYLGDVLYIFNSLFEVQKILNSVGKLLKIFSLKHKQTSEEQTEVVFLSALTFIRNGTGLKVMASTRTSVLIFYSVKTN